MDPDEWMQDGFGSYRRHQPTQEDRPMLVCPTCMELYELPKGEARQQYYCKACATRMGITTDKEDSEKSIRRFKKLGIMLEVSPHAGCRKRDDQEAEQFAEAWASKIERSEAERYRNHRRNTSGSTD